MNTGNGKKSWWKFLMSGDEDPAKVIAPDDSPNAADAGRAEPASGGMGSEFSESTDLPAAAFADVAESAIPVEEEPDDSEEEAEGEEEDGGEVTANQINPELEQDDPLGEAYDLELGSKLPRDGSGAQGPWRTEVTSPKEFFTTEILYRYDILEDEEQSQVHGTYRIELRGQNGGIWTITLKEQMEVVNRREDADIVFSMGQRDFLNLINGRLNPQLALLSQKMRVTGDMRRAVAFQNILSPNAD